MVKMMLTVVLIMALGSPTIPGTFKTEQQRYERVRTAYSQKETELKNLFADKKVQWGNHEVFIRAFKQEKILQLFARTKGQQSFTWVRNYNFCMLSGQLGPKRQSGDMQVPEGFYHIDRFNPVSSFYLSLGINYPNASDRILGTKSALGGDIFLHGDCVSIGCIPITDEKIKELYIACIEAKDGGQQEIPVHIFPARMNEANMEKLLSDANNTKAAFWQNLQQGYALFQENNTMSQPTVSASGSYVFAK